MVGTAFITCRHQQKAWRAEERIQAVRETLAVLVDKISLDLKSRTYEIHYKLHTGINVASPRGCSVNPVCWLSHGVVVRRVA